MLKLKYVKKASAIYEKYFSSQVVMQCIGLAEKFATCFNHHNTCLYLHLRWQHVNKLYAYCTCI